MDAMRGEKWMEGGGEKWMEGGGENWMEGGVRSGCDEWE